MKAFYGRGAYTRSNLPRLRLVNMFVESTPADEDGVVLMSRKGLTEHSVIAGEIKGVYREEGVFDGDVFCVAGSTLYRGTTAIGAITGSGPVSFAGTATQLAVCAGESIHVYNGTTLVAATFPDGANVKKVIFHDGLFIAARADSHKYYWSAVLDATSWGALDFASAESRPDDLLDIHVSNDMLYLFGGETTEPWANTGNADAPYQRQELALMSKGIRATGCLTEIDGGIFYVGNDNIAYVLRGAQAERISDHGIEERVAASATCSTFSFIEDGHAFFVIRLATETFAYDIATKSWCEFASQGETNFLLRCATRAGDSAIFGGDGKLYTLSGYDDDGGEIEKLFTVAIPFDGGAVAIDNLEVNANTGWTELLAGQGSNPLIELRTSRDAGATFNTWRSAPLGEQGEYLTRSIWRRLGTFASPGFYGEIRCTDPVALRVSSVTVNEAGGGRSR